MSVCHGCRVEEFINEIQTKNPNGCQPTEVPTSNVGVSPGCRLDEPSTPFYERPMILNAAQQSQQHPVRPDMTIPVDGMGPPVTGGGIRDTAAMALKMPSPSISWESHQ